MTAHAEVRILIARRGLILHKNVRWEMTDSTAPTEESIEAGLTDRDVTTDINEAEAVGSRNALGLHDVLLDLDMEALLVESSSPGHFHLYAPVGCSWEDYLAFLNAAAKIGLIESGYARASEARGMTALRLPWVKKGSERECVANGGTFPEKRWDVTANSPSPTTSEEPF